MKKGLCIKTILFMMFIYLFNIIDNSVHYLIGNSLAMNQMTNSIDSNLWYQVYSEIYNYQFVIFIFVALLLYYREIKYLLKQLKEKKENE